MDVWCRRTGMTFRKELGISMKQKLSRRFGAAVLAVALTGCTGARLDAKTKDYSGAAPDSDLARQLKAPADYTFAYSSPSGITQIRVDAQVIVPDTKELSVYEALPRVFTQQEAQALCDFAGTDSSWRDPERKEAYPGKAQFIREENGWGPGVDDYSFWYTSQDERNEQYASVHGDYGMRSDGSVAVVPVLKYERALPSTQREGAFLPVVGEWEPLGEDNRAQNCTISLDEAVKQADELVHRLCPDYELTSFGQTPIYDLVDPNAHFYSFFYTRHLDGTAVNWDASSEQVRAEEYDYTCGQGSFAVVVADSGVVAADYCNPFDVGKVLQENCALLSFAEIMEVFETMAPLSRQYMEAYEGLESNCLDIYQIRLGYMSVKQPGGEYQYIPVWDFYGRQSLSGTGGYGNASQIEDQWGRSYLTVNAIDGTVVDREYGY